MSTRPILHMIGIFHTITSSKYSHCAFTGKVLRFSKMMNMYGYKVIEYSNGKSESEAYEKVPLLTEKELEEFKGKTTEKDFVGNHAVVGSPLWKEFDKRLIIEMLKRVKDRDIICYPFGDCHPKLVTLFPECYHVETGIGYPSTFSNFRIFESYIIMHWHLGKANDACGKNYNWVVPNYYDRDDWEVNLKPDNYILYFGRIIPDKGLPTVCEIANRINIPVIICGQGDPTPWLAKSSNIKYLPPIHGKERSKLLGGALCILMPTEFIEPFGGSGVEAQLCGTPLISTNFGAFTETVVPGVTGYRCNTLGDWLEAVKNVHKLDRKQVADIARSKYSLEVCGKSYDRIFRMIADLADKGWYKETSYLEF